MVTTNNEAVVQTSKIVGRIGLLLILDDPKMETICFAMRHPFQHYFNVISIGQFNCELFLTNVNSQLNEVTK